MEVNLNLSNQQRDIGEPVNRFTRAMEANQAVALRRDDIRILQINLGKLCNQACKHCHVEAGPKRTEIMTWDAMERLLVLAENPGIEQVDLTGGAPEMNPHFRQLVTRLTKMGKSVLIRCNLTIVVEPGYEWLSDFYVENKVRLVCSLPCYTAENVKKQRGSGVFEKSIAALRKLNALGYGVKDHPAGLVLDLVYNPGGAFLPGNQAGLEADYKRELSRHFGVSFNQLMAVANLPIGRFASDLVRQGTYETYLQLLEGAFNRDTVNGLMCRNTLNVGWDGQFYDCDFNQMLEMPLGGGSPTLKDERLTLEGLREVPIRTGEHCLGCSAGSGSSCGGSLA